ncbi:PTS lactose/cellobiose transporter subunit IIA [Vagococcus salmoninarum]|uniref:PTS lactose/cellobiose transporter subunit IIA n=1 Tax=Vagococcus salmoninarum TaxID=2739 RepID=UPI003F9A3CF5
MNEQEKEIFKMIATSGDSRGAAFEALRLARKKKFNEAKEKLEEARLKANEAHKVQTDLITKELNGEGESLTLLTVHAQDHLMTSLLARDLIEELIMYIEEENQK